jgi:colanic acid biosynthesis glycosyl transferase WcaI
MRILIQSLYCSPDLVGIGKYTGELAEWLALRGHDVRVVAAPPFYPEWKIKSGYTALLYKVEKNYIFQRLLIIRCPIWIPSVKSGFTRILHLLSFAFTSFPVMLLQISWRPNVVITLQPPLFCSISAIVLASITKAKLIMHIQDFEVDAAYALGILKSNYIKKIVANAERSILRRCHKVSVISEGMQAHLIQKNFSEDESIIFPNWIDTDLIFPLSRPSKYRAWLKIPLDKVVLLYSGNIGEKQGLELIIDAAEKLQVNPRVFFVLCGDGVSKLRLMERSAGLNNIAWLPLQPVNSFNEFLNLADIHLMPQVSSVNNLVFPSKLTGMCASGRPIIATVKEESGLGEFIKKASYFVDQYDVIALINTIEYLSNNSDVRKKLGEEARKIALKFFDKDYILKDFEAELLDLFGTS